MTRRSSRKAEAIRTELLQGLLSVVKALGVSGRFADDSFVFESRKLQQPVTTVASVLSTLVSVSTHSESSPPVILWGRFTFEHFGG